MRTYRERVEKYEDFLKGWVEEVEPENRLSVLADLEDFWYFRVKLDGEEVRAIDKKYLPKIYARIAEKQPELLDYFLDLMKRLGIDLTIFQECPVQSPQ